MWGYCRTQVYNLSLGVAQTDVTKGYVGSIVWRKVREEGEGQVDIHETILQLLCLIYAITTDLFKLTHITIGHSVNLLDSFL